MRLDEDDLLRADLIQQLMCQAQIPIGALERRYAIDFHDYFADSLALLRPLQDDGLVRIGADRITATTQGRLLLRNIAMCRSEEHTSELQSLMRILYAVFCLQK